MTRSVTNRNRSRFQYVSWLTLSKEPFVPPREDWRPERKRFIRHVNGVCAAQIFCTYGDISRMSAVNELSNMYVFFPFSTTKTLLRRHRSKLHYNSTGPDPLIVGSRLTRVNLKKKMGCFTKRRVRYWTKHKRSIPEQLPVVSSKRRLTASRKNRMQSKRQDCGRGKCKQPIWVPYRCNYVTITLH